MRRIWCVALVLGMTATPGSAQGGGVLPECEPAVTAQPDVAAAELFRRVCTTVLQGLVSTHPQLAILAASGNPVLASHSAGGLRLGRFAPVDATLRLEAAGVRVPNLLARDTDRLRQRLAVLAPALSADLAVGVFDGVALAPQLRGIGALDLLASVGALPLALVGVRGFAAGAGTVGMGARLGLVREGFVTPGASVSLQHHWLGRVAFGSVCPAGESPSPRGPACPAPGSSGEFAFGLRSWSGRAVVGRRFAGLGVTGGAGYDRLLGSGEYAFLAPPAVPGGPILVHRREDRELREGRWSTFANTSYTHLLLTLGAEVGWMQGGSAIAGFERFPSDFNPRHGTFFGGVGGRIAF